MPLALTSRSSSVASTRALGPEVKETELDRLLKLIPTEIVTLYAAILPIAPEVPWRYFPLMTFVVGLLLVPSVLALDGWATKEHAGWPQYVIRTLAFAVWALAVMWPFAPWLDPGRSRWIIALAVPLVPFLGSRLLRVKSPQPPTS